MMEVEDREQSNHYATIITVENELYSPAPIMHLTTFSTTPPPPTNYLISRITVRHGKYTPLLPITLLTNGPLAQGNS
jgi:hypothetical protein